MVSRIGYDQVSLDRNVAVEEDDEEIIFRDVVIAREIVQPYDIDGELKKAYKPASELEDAYWTAEGRWIIMDQHPTFVVIERRDDIHGRMKNLRFVKNLKDAKTRRPMIRGIVADLHFFKRQISEDKQEDLKSLRNKDVSIGFFYDFDETSGEWRGEKYDFIQRRLFIDHLAGPVSAGRCPMPYCGIGADIMPSLLGRDPEETPKNIEVPGPGGDCAVTATITISEEQGIQARYCGEEKEIRTYLFSKEKGWTMEKAKSWVEEHKGDNIMSGQDMTVEEIENKIKELQAQRTTLQEKVDEYYSERDPFPDDIREAQNKVWEIEKEIETYQEAKVNKMVESDQEQTDRERFIEKYEVTEEQMNTLLEIMGEAIYDLLPERGEGAEQQTREEFMAECLESGKTMEECAAAWEAKQGEGGDCLICDMIERLGADRVAKLMKDALGKDVFKKLKDQEEGEQEEERERMNTRCAKYPVSPHVEEGGHVTKPSEYEGISEDMFGDPCNYKYPMTEKYVMAAYAYVSKAENRSAGGYSEEEWTWIKNRIEAQMEAEGHEIGGEEPTAEDLAEQTRRLLDHPELYQT